MLAGGELVGPLTCPVQVSGMVRVRGAARTECEAAELERVWMGA